jgi:predicted homoserine dehydrogenase-like protein
MFNSFLDGTKSAIEMAAVANACGLNVPHDGLGFPPCGADDLASVLRPRHLGGALAGDGMVEVVSSLRRDGQPVERDLRWGVYVVFKAESDYAASCFKQYGLPTDSTGRYAAMYKPYHLIGLELSISVLNVALRGEPMLDGEGGYTVYAKLIPAARSRKLGGLPIGLANHVKLVRDVAAGDFVTAADVVLAKRLQAIRVRREMEAQAQDPAEVADTA